MGLDRPDQDGERACAGLCCCWAIALVALHAMQASTRPIASRVRRRAPMSLSSCAVALSTYYSVSLLRLEPSGTTAAFHLQRRGLSGPQTLGAPPPRALCRGFWCLDCQEQTPLAHLLPGLASNRRFALPGRPLAACNRTMASQAAFSCACGAAAAAAEAQCH